MWYKGRARSVRSVHQIQDPRDHPVHHGRSTGPEDHQPPGHIQETLP